MKRGGLPEEVGNPEDAKEIPMADPVDDLFRQVVMSPFLIFTDLDGTLLDHETYRWKEAEPALALCRRRSVPVILVSSKTRAEMDVLRVQLGLSSPYISENGGGIFFPVGGISTPPPVAVHDGGSWKWSLGPPYEHLVEALDAIRKELGWSIRGFSEMSPHEISQLTGLNPETGRLAAMREFDEPFVVSDPQVVDMEALDAAAKGRGLQVTIGGRFYHLQGKNDKGEAVRKLIAWYRDQEPASSLITMALGDSPNDFTMLQQVDCPVLVRSRRSYPEWGDKIPGLSVTRETGPRGWNKAVLKILSRSLKGGESRHV
jgi:mannosyl-3-phosphoglycerate phosphatase